MVKNNVIMVNHRILFMAALCSVSSLWAQENVQGITQCGTPTGQPAFPVKEFTELPDPKPFPAEDWKSVKGTLAAWGTKDVRYPKHQVPTRLQKGTAVLQGWKGEKVHTQAVIWTGVPVQDLQLEVTPFRNGNYTFPASSVQAHFERYVMTDQLNLDGKGGCGHRPDHSLYDSLLVADAIDHLLPSMELPAQTTEPVWVSCFIPVDAPAGTYAGKLKVKDGEKVLKELQLSVVVNKRMLPAPHDWAFHLDLWQNPYAVARYYQVPVWSEEHLDAMQPIMQRLADAGQKAITVSIQHKPWEGQTEDYFESMVTWIKKLNGQWAFDYQVFDRWVEFMMRLGIDEQISCFSMVPWGMNFQYFDQRTNQMQTVHCEPGSFEYDEMWTAMLRSFSKHLKERGWFNRCVIAMDERPKDVMLKVLDIIRSADPGFKVSLAGNYYPELSDALYDYCITIGQKFPEDVKAKRDAEGKVSTLYTCCTEPWPNTFTFSDPAEAAWIGFFVAKQKVDGYLRWAYNSWPLEPLLDSRFRSWAAGDTYLVYPGDRTSIRFERLLEGIQNWEKILILKEEFTAAGKKKELKQIEDMLQAFDLQAIPNIPAETMVNKAEQILNNF